MLDRETGIKSRLLGFHRPPIDDQFPIIESDYQAALGRFASTLEDMMEATEPVRSRYNRDPQAEDLDIGEAED